MTVPQQPESLVAHKGPPAHAPNAALLIDFDNVTMGIRSDLQAELRRLLQSDIIHGKVAVQRAYADWRRYPQYIVPLSESSIDLIFAPAVGPNKKNATDIRLAIDALELVFTRPEIGTFILLSGDSDFSALVLKLKEYGKYVVGVGFRESSSDMLIQNCDEYYSYTDIAGFVREGDAPSVRRDPWEVVVEAVGRMQRGGEAMRSDRLKQVMQQIDPNFTEKEAGFSRFSRFVHEASTRGLVSVEKLPNGQLEVSLGPEANPDLVADEDLSAVSFEPAAVRKKAAPRKARGVPVRGMDLADAFALLRKALQALGGGEDVTLEAEAVRQEMLALHAEEDPILEHPRFAKLLRQAHDASVIEVRKKEDGAYELRLLPQAEREEPEEPKRRTRVKKEGRKPVAGETKPKRTAKKSSRQIDEDGPAEALAAAKGESTPASGDEEDVSVETPKRRTVRHRAPAKRAESRTAAEGEPAEALAAVKGKSTPAYGDEADVSVETPKRRTVRRRAPAKRAKPRTPAEGEPAEEGQGVAQVSSPTVGASTELTGDDDGAKESKTRTGRSRSGAHTRSPGKAAGTETPPAEVAQGGEDERLLEASRTAASDLGATAEPRATKGGRFRTGSRGGKRPGQRSDVSAPGTPVPRMLSHEESAALVKTESAASPPRAPSGPHGGSSPSEKERSSGRRRAPREERTSPPRREDSEPAGRNPREERPKRRQRPPTRSRGERSEDARSGRREGGRRPPAERANTRGRGASAPQPGGKDTGQRDPVRPPPSPEVSKREMSARKGGFLSRIAKSLGLTDDEAK